MTKIQSYIDFTNLISPVPGEGLEQLVRQIGRRKGLSPVWSGRGPDGGRDLLFLEILSGSISNHRIKWLVSCKDRAGSGESVTERDLPASGIRDKLDQHRADGFLLVTTTTVSASAKALIDGLDRSTGGSIHTCVWDSSELAAILLEAGNQDLLKQFLPESYKLVKGLTSIEGALLSFTDHLPDSVLSEVIQLVKPYSGSRIKGSVIWPNDPTFAIAADAIMAALLKQDDITGAVKATDGMGLDNFTAFISALHRSYPTECFGYLSQVVKQHPNPDIRYNSYQFLADNYDLTRQDILDLAPYVDDESSLIEIAEVVSFVKSHLLSRTEFYELYSQVDDLSGGARINEIEVININYEVRVSGRIDFFGAILVEAVKEVGVKRISFTGTFEGYLDKQAIYLDSAALDVST